MSNNMHAFTVPDRFRLPAIQAEAIRRENGSPSPPPKAKQIIGGFRKG